MIRGRVERRRTARSLGLRREVALFLPTALALLLALSAYASLSYRAGVTTLVEERRSEAARLARHAAETLGGEPVPDGATLQRAAPAARGVALIAADGEALALAGTLAEGFGSVDLAAPLGGARTDGGIGIGPGAATAGAAIGFAPLLLADGQRALVRVDLAGEALAAEARSAAIVVRLVIAVDLAVALLVLLFLRRLLGPWESLLQRARQMGGTMETDGDDAAFVLASFDRAMRGESERLAATLTQVGELAAGVAHELRNSLATLRGYLALLERSLAAGQVGAHPEPSEGSGRAGSGEGSVPAAAAGHLAEIKREADRLQRVLEDFLSFARPGSTRRETLDLERIARRAAADPALEAVPVEIEVTGPTRLEGDGQLLERAVRNLLSNAAEAQREAGAAGSLLVRVGDRGEGIELAVDDRGAGVPSALRERLFEPFATGRAGGVGLGLALARRIVLLHGGVLTLEDLAGGGTRARMSFSRGDYVTHGNTSGGDPG